MPNRIIKESFCDSEKIAALSDFEFRLWVGLITQADDAGRGDARPAIIKGRVFPLRDRTTAKDIEAALHALAAKGCVTLYTVGGRPYFWFPSWAKHQRIRDCKPKFPGPDEADKKQPSSEFCGELPQVAASCGLNPIQSEYNPNPNTKGETRARRAAPPTLDEVKAYAQGKGLHLDTQQFFDYFDTGGWVDAKGQPVRNWKQKMLTWEKYEPQKGGNGSKAQPNYQPSAQRIQQSSDWLDAFLAEQEENG